MINALKFRTVVASCMTQRPRQTGGHPIWFSDKHFVSSSPDMFEILEHTQGSSWGLTVGRSDFSLQENKGEVTVR